MIEDLMHSLNGMLLQHPDLLHVMYVLFWIKYWILTAIMGVFLYLVYFRNQQYPLRKTASDNKQKPSDAFIA
jgi:hypothetical protein